MIEEIFRHDKPEDLLTKKPNKLFIKDREGKGIIIGAPHHGRMTAIGRSGDKNVGFIAWTIAVRLGVCSIIACNYSSDPNKTFNSDYSKQIVGRKPVYLIEIHGHGGIKACKNCIEISSGNAARNRMSMDFAKNLKNKMDKHQGLKKYDVSGNFHRIHFKAEESATINTDKWMPYHIELPLSLREIANGEFPEFVEDFIVCLKETVDEICG